jgi:homoserine dehydrogenase
VIEDAKELKSQLQAHKLDLAATNQANNDLCKICKAAINGGIPVISPMAENIKKKKDSKMVLKRSNIVSSSCNC